ncbi:hypothetical protein [Antarcticibacterium arcticum]
MPGITRRIRLHGIGNFISGKDLQVSSPGKEIPISAARSSVKASSLGLLTGLGCVRLYSTPGVWREIDLRSCLPEMMR